jgi:hypothetical protein
VIDLPDGSPGTIRCDATDVLGVVELGLRSVLDGAGLRALHRLVGQLATRAEVGVARRCTPTAGTTCTSMHS